MEPCDRDLSTTTSTARCLPAALTPLMALVCQWSKVKFPIDLATPPSKECVAAAHEAIKQAEERTLARSQRERVQIVALVECVTRCFENDTLEIVSNIASVLIALATVVTGTAKNHAGNEVINGLSDINTKSIFLQHFSTYSQAENWLASRPTGALKDVFGEFTWTKMKKNNFLKSEVRVKAAAIALGSLEYPTQIENVVRVLKKNTPPIVGGKLTKFFTIAAFTMLGLIHKDKHWREWAPANYTAGSGCVNWLKEATSNSTLDGDGVKTLLSSMLAFLPESITFLDLENVACKAHVLKFNGKQQHSSVGSGDGGVGGRSRARTAGTAKKRKHAGAGSDSKKMRVKEEEDSSSSTSAP